MQHEYGFRLKKLNHQLVENSLVSDIDRIIAELEHQEILARMKPIISRYIGQSFTKGSLKAIADLRRARYDVSFAYTPSDMKAVSMMIDHNLIMVQGMSDDMKKEVMRTLSTGFLEGKSVDKISRAMVERINVSKDRAMMIARTETIRSYNQASIERYKSAGLEQWRWITAMDERACDECMSYDNEIFDNGDSQPPAHPNCRCAVAPYIDENLTPSPEDSAPSDEQPSNEDLPGWEPPQPDPDKTVEPKQTESEMKISEEIVKENMQKNIIDFEDEIKKNNDWRMGKKDSFETCRYVDENGNVVFNRKGITLPDGSKAVDVSDPNNHYEYDPAIKAHIEKGDLIGTHNHPSGRSFSALDGDLGVTIDINGKEYRAVAELPDGRTVRYVIERPEGGWGKADQELRSTIANIEFDMSEEHRLAEQKLYKDIDEGRLQSSAYNDWITEENKLYAHRLFTKLQERLPNRIKYRREII
jgi:SPP1 gp7 family putative phage head morphogenesis protein